VSLKHGDRMRHNGRQVQSGRGHLQKIVEGPVLGRTQEVAE
jgi:hypothetical protein